VTFCLTVQPDLQIEFVVDTGFEGALTLPATAVARLGLPYLTGLTANLADSSSIRRDVHLAAIIWNGVEQEVAVLVLEGQPLLGTALLENCRLMIEFMDGGNLVINDL
jgi:clan AA aspartic protease